MWGMDFIIGLFLFILVLLITVKLTLDIYPSQSHTDTYRDAVHLSDDLLTQGYPLNWTSTDVLVPGIAFNNRINTSKLSEFSQLDYYRAKTLMHVSSNFIFFISNSTSIINTTRCIYGYPVNMTSGCTPVLTGLGYNDLSKVERIVLFNSKVVTLTVYAWN
jgi:hypothetical protein